MLCFTSTMIWQICRACRWSAKNKKRKGKRKRSSLNKLLSTTTTFFLNVCRLCGLQYVIYKVSCFAKTNVNSIGTVFRRRRSEEWQWRWRKNKQSEINQSTDCKLMSEKTRLDAISSQYCHREQTNWNERAKKSWFKKFALNLLQESLQNV